MRAFRVAGIVVLVAGACLLAALAHDLRSWPPAIAQGDVRLRAGQPTSWTASTLLPQGWSEALLGVHSQRSLRAAIHAFDETYATPSAARGGFAALRARDEAEAALGASGEDGNNSHAAQALDLLALLQFGDSAAGGGAPAAIRAITDLNQAIGLDPADEDAKANLELALRLLEARGTRAGPSSGPGPKSAGAEGGGTGVAGEGY